jgi:predicted metal-binding membrane protein
VNHAIVARVLSERVLLVFTLLVLVALSWAYLAWMAVDMAAQSGASMAHCAAMPGMTSSSAMYVFWLFVMWAVMGVAMMLPTALPLVSLYARFHRQRHPQVPALGPALCLVLGYLLAWFAFGAAAAFVQWGFEQLGTLTPVMGEVRSPVAGGLVLVGAGLFQLSPLKTACLSKCRTPLAFLMTRWREGKGGALAMGVEHGAFCLGCCWALMLVMFVVGVMNLLWMALLGVLMLLEKVAPRGDLLARLSGVALVVLGVARVAVD